MKINGYEYSENEILDALRKKGYLILPYKTYNESHIHGSHFHKEWYNTKCAVKGAEIPSDENIYSKVAVREFEKEFTKPNLM